MHLNFGKHPFVTKETPWFLSRQCCDLRQPLLAVWSCMRAQIHADTNAPLNPQPDRRQHNRHAVTRAFSFYCLFSSDEYSLPNN